MKVRQAANYDDGNYMTLEPMFSTKNILCPYCCSPEIEATGEATYRCRECGELFAEPEAKNDY